MESTNSTSYEIGYTVGHFISVSWPFLLFGLVAFIAFKYWTKRKGKTTY